VGRIRIAVQEGDGDAFYVGVAKRGRRFADRVRVERQTAPTRGRNPFGNPIAQGRGTNGGGLSIVISY